LGVRSGEGPAAPGRGRRNRAPAGPAPSCARRACSHGPVLDAAHASLCRDLTKEPFSAPPQYWGLDGYVFIHRGKDCGIASDAVYAKVGGWGVRWGRWGSGEAGAVGLRGAAEPQSGRRRAWHVGLGTRGARQFTPSPATAATTPQVDDAHLQPGAPERALALALANGARLAAASGGAAAAAASDAAPAAAATAAAAAA
jgi:hypothetical protein